MSKFLIGLIVGLLTVPLLVYSYFATGMAPVATAAGGMPFEETLAHMALRARMEKEMPKSVPIAADEAAYDAGAAIYRDNCAVCHGLPLSPMSHIAQGMAPKPPQLLEGTGVTDDPPGETYWKVAGGIRMTGMPGFEKSLSSTQVWQVSLLVANADKLPASAKQILVGGTAPAAPTTTAPPNMPTSPQPAK
jgi:mono/diheme cytochrome c family protein